MLTSDEQALLATVDSLQESLIERTADLVRIPTVNPYSGDASAATEAPGQEWITRQFERLGARVFRVPVPPDVYQRGGVIGPPDRSWEGRDNVVAEWRIGSGHGPTILLNDHMDTVGTEGMEFDPFEPVIRDGRMYGRGTSDTKGNMVAGLTAIEAFLRFRPQVNGRILFESVVDEECNGGGAGTLACCLAGVRGDFVIALDGSRGTVDTGCNGVATARVRVRGRAGHSSVGESVNAIDKAIVAKGVIDAFAREHRQRFPNCMVNIGVFRAGTLPAIVPDMAEMQINLSYDITDAEEARKRTGHWGGALFRARFEKALSQLSKADPWFADYPAEVSWIKDLYPYRCDPNDPLIRMAAQAATDAFGEPVELKPMTAWADAAHLARHLGVPVAGMGAGTPGEAHTAHEYVVLDDLVKGAKAVALTIHRFFVGWPFPGAGKRDGES